MNSTTTTTRSDDRLMLAVVIASALHVLVIFGITFDALRPTNNQYQVEVTLVQTAGERPEDALHIAQANQQGSGTEALRARAAGQQSSRQQTTAEAPPATLSRRIGRDQLNAPAVSSPLGERRINDRSGEQHGADDLPETDRELARLNQRLAQLEASLDAQTRPQSEQPRVRRLEAVAAQAAVDAAYLAQWRSRVESVGNQYYPQASLRYGIFGNLRMLVTVRSDGELESVRLLKPSGYAVLDEAAIRIVRMAAPFPPFSRELAATTDKLEIVRTWQFEQNALGSE